MCVPSRDVRKGVDELVNQLAPRLLRGIAFQKLVEGHPVDVFHDDAGPQRLVHLLGLGLHDAGMVELYHQLVLLLQQLHIDGLTLVFGLQPFQQKPPPLTLRLHQLVEAVALQWFVGSAHVGWHDELFLDGSRCA